MSNASEHDESEFYYPEESSEAKLLKPNNFYWKQWEMTILLLY